MANGLRILPDDNGKYIQIDTSSRMMSSLGRFQVAGANDTGDTQVSVQVPQAVGRSVIIPNQTFDIIDNAGSGIPLINLLKGVSVSGTTMTLYFNQGAPYRSFKTLADLNVFDITPSQPQSYGIAFYDSTNFLAITDQNRFGYVVYRATVNVSPVFTLPSDIPNIDNCVVFANWDNPNDSLWYDRGARQLQAYSSFSSSDGSALTGSISNVQILIVASGFTPPKPNGGWGLIIRNAQGVITFSSKYMPVIYKGGYYSFPYYLENDTGNPAKEDYRSVTGPVSRPMVPLCSLGFMCGDFKQIGSNGLRPVCLSGFKMSGGRVTTFRAKPFGRTIASNFSPVRAQVNYDLPVLDGVDYI